MAKVSVLVAAYNVEAYIEACMKSVMGQSMQDIEIIVVDDGSTDGTAAKIQALAKEDTRIQLVMHTENRSLMQARKTAFQHSSGAYMMYVDGDDLLAPDACEKAYQAITTEKTDLLQFGTDIFAQDAVRDQQAVQAQKQTIGCIPHRVESHQSCGLLSVKDKAGRIPMNVWNKIYRREIIEKINENLPDDYINMAEDKIFSFFAQYYSHSYASIPDELYRYRVGTGMSTTSALSRSKIDGLTKMYALYNYLRDWVEKQNEMAQCGSFLAHLEESWLGDIAVNFLCSCQPQDWDCFVQQMDRYCPRETFLAALFDVVYGKQAADASALAEACTVFDYLQPKTKAKTIGAFYGRLRSGGIENVMCKLADIWARNGYNVVLFTGEEPQEDDYSLNPAVQRVVLPTLQQRNLESFRERVNLWKQYLTQYGVDILVYHAWQDPMMLPDAIAVKNAGVPLVMHTHGLFCVNYINPEMQYVYNNMMLDRYYQYADMIVALSETDQAWWKSCGLRCVKTMNPTGLTLDVSPARLSGKNIVFVGRISPEKQILDALDIFARVQAKVPDATLTIVGGMDDADYAEQVNSFIAEKHLSDSVILAGYHKEVLPFYQQAAVALCTSRFEGQSLAISEELICGLPLVTYELPNSDFIRAGKGMCVVRQKDVQGAADALVQLLTDDALRIEMGRAARASAEAAFGVDLAQHWDAIFQETLQPKPDRPMLCNCTPMDTAVALLNEYTSEGMRIRSGNGSLMSGDAQYYKMQCNQLNQTIEELRNSTTYRLGAKMLSIPKKLKSLLHRS